jgi:hypothetical protein
VRLINELSYNRGLEFADHIPEWKQLCQELKGISADEIEGRHLKHKTPKKGAQPALNAVISERLRAAGFDVGPYVFPTKKLAKDRGLLGDPSGVFPKDGKWPYPRLQMDFKKGHLAVEVQFNNAASLEHTVFKLNAAFRDIRVLPEDLMLVGVLVLASTALKRWGNMDSTVQDFESVEKKLELLAASVAVPLIVLGLDGETDWPDVSETFPGTGHGGGKG